VTQSDDNCTIIFISLNSRITALRSILTAQSTEMAPVITSHFEQNHK